MPVFNVQMLRRVTVHNEDHTESQSVDRLLIAESAIIALDANAAVAIVARKLSPEITNENLSTAMVRVQKVCD